MCASAPQTQVLFSFSPTRCAFVFAPPLTKKTVLLTSLFVFALLSVASRVFLGVGAQDGRGSPRPQGDHHASRQRSGHGDAAAGGRPDQHVQETGELVLL